MVTMAQRIEELRMARNMSRPALGGGFGSAQDRRGEI